MNWKLSQIRLWAENYLIFDKLPLYRPRVKISDFSLKVVSKELNHAKIGDLN